MHAYLRRVLVVAFLFALAGTAPALADDFVAMPEAKASAENLKIRVVKYDGNTNGEMVVEVKNTGRTTATFSSDGLFFVPKGDPEKAPQRLGAAGPFTELAGKRSIVRQGTMVVAAGKTTRIRLEVFCIDSHRSSPSSSTKFSVAKSKLPKSLRRELKKGNDAIYRKNRGRSLGHSKGEVQSNVWTTRDKDWVKLEGERAQEKGPRKGGPRRRRRLPVQRQDR